MLENLLFLHTDDNGKNAGLLVRLNSDIPLTPSDDTSPNDGEPEESATIHDIAAVLLTLNSDLDKVIQQMNTIPAKQVTGTLKAKSKLAEQIQASSTGNDPAKRKWASKMRSDAKKRKAFDPRTLRTHPGQPNNAQPSKVTE